MKSHFHYSLRNTTGLATNELVRHLRHQLWEYRAVSDKTSEELPSR